MANWLMLWFSLLGEVSVDLDLGTVESKWQSRLIRVEYKGDKIHARYQYYSNLNHLMNENTGFFSIPLNSPLRSRIIKASAFILDKPIKKKFTKSVNYHIVEAKTECGEFFTLEKGKDCILIQSSRRVDLIAKPICRLQKNGKKRDKLKSIKRIVVEPEPKPMTIYELLLWINDRGEDGLQVSKLMEPYHVTNCQQFAAHLWNKLSNVTYPHLGASCQMWHTHILKNLYMEKSPEARFPDRV